MKETYGYKIDEKSKIILIETPEISRFSIVYLFFTDRWIDIARLTITLMKAGKRRTYIGTRKRALSSGTSVSKRRKIQ